MSMQPFPEKCVLSIKAKKQIMKVNNTSDFINIPSSNILHPILG